MNIKFSPFNKENDIKQQRSLFKECFPENNGTPVENVDHYLWKFHSLAEKPTSFEFAAFVGDELIGYYAALPFSYFISGNYVKVGMVCDVMTGVKARGKRVFTNMGIYATRAMQEKGVDFTTGFPIRREVIPGHLKAGWYQMFKLPLYMNFLSTKSLFAEKKIKFLFPLVDLFLIGFNYLITLFQKDKSYEVTLYSSLELDQIGDFDLFIEKWIKENKIALNKDKNYLKWRLSGPEKSYKIVIARSNNVLVGYAIFCRIFKEGVPSIAILDLSCLRNYQRLSSTIIAYIQEYAKLLEAEIIMIMANKRVANLHGLIRNGFLKSPFKFWFIIKNLSGSYSYSLLKNEANWHLTWIDTDDL